MKKKFIAWGHIAPSNTFSYIHSAFVKAFAFMGWETMHLPNTENTKNISFDNSVFFVEGTDEGKIPIIKNCKYIIHNSPSPDLYSNIPEQNILKLQVYSNGNDSLGVSGSRINKYTYFDAKSRTLYQPWATDLLPSEVSKTIDIKTNKEISYCGTIWDGKFGNVNQISSFVNEAEPHGYTFQHYPHGTTSFKRNLEIIKNSELSPTIVGRWQKENDYIPCRIFKNISYGSLGITNSKICFNLFGNSIIYSEKELELFNKYINSTDSEIKKMFTESSNIVKNNHTYINRAEQILKVL